MNNDELFEKIRRGSEDDAKKAYNKLLRERIKSLAVTIMARNFSHNVGRNLTKRNGE